MKQLFKSLSILNPVPAVLRYHRGLAPALEGPGMPGGAPRRRRARRIPPLLGSGGRHRRRLRLLGLSLIPVLLAAIGVLFELRTSTLQSRLFWSQAQTLGFTVEPGPSRAIVYPRHGPFDQRRGYTRLPQFIAALNRADYTVTEQARVSPAFLQLSRWGIHPPYDEAPLVGLRIAGSDGSSIYDSISGQAAFQSFDDVPPLIASALVFIENRELAEPAYSTTNPAIEWDRLARAGLLHAGRKVGLPLSVEGGSTLAVQLEKFRHYPGGRTGSPQDKLKQIASASLKAYQAGPDTEQQRRRIVVDYLNTMPLAAQLGYGEVNGLGEGLRVWFGQDLNSIALDLGSDVSVVRARAFKHVLALIAAVRAPSYFLITDREALEARIAHYTTMMQDGGLLTAGMAGRVRDTPLEFIDRAPARPLPPHVERKHIDSLRTYLMTVLGARDYYDLDHMDIEVNTPLDAQLQSEVVHLLGQLKDPEFVRANGLGEDRLVGNGDPGQIDYSLTLFERTRDGNQLRVQADTLDREFDLNRGMKMELGSTAKLRTTAHYLEIVGLLHEELADLDADELAVFRESFDDPISQWSINTVRQRGPLTLEALLELALDRRYSANPGEVFFTGGGAHRFNNFDPKENGQHLSVRQAFRQSTNLVFIRLMRDLVSYHRARLPYDAHAVINDAANPVRRRLLVQAGDDEARQILYRAFRGLRGLQSDELVGNVLGSRAGSIRHLTILFLAWNPGAGPAELGVWLRAQVGSVSDGEVERMLRSYDSTRLTLKDYGYLLDKHPLEVWTAGVLHASPDTGWSELLASSDDARGVVTAWLVGTRDRRIQDSRLRTRIERDAFERMTPYWKRMGFPFDTLVPSLATSIGSSSDRPIALADLMGVILNDGVRLPEVRVSELRMAAGTPYETAFRPRRMTGERVLDPGVARAMRALLGEVVEQGTARRLSGALVLPDGTRVAAGGKTGSGDNRYRETSSTGQVISSRAVNRTATFVFYLGDRYFGVVTAHVDGPIAEQHRFTSALPVTVVKLLAPRLISRLSDPSSTTE